jgi:hypothetical protein
VRHTLEEFLDQHLKETRLEKEPESPLFPAAIGKTGKLSRWPLRTDAADMLKRRLKQAGLPAHYSPHSFRATGITNFLENDGTLEAAQRIAAMPIAGLQNSLTAAARMSSDDNGFGIFVPFWLYTIVRFSRLSCRECFMRKSDTKSRDLASL